MPNAERIKINEAKRRSNDAYQAANKVNGKLAGLGEPVEVTPYADTDTLGIPYHLIPRGFDRRLALVFQEGLRYGEDNWKKGKGDQSFINERYNHAKEHLEKWLEGDESEDHLAKVAWFCSVMMWFEQEGYKMGTYEGEPIP